MPVAQLSRGFLKRLYINYVCKTISMSLVCRVNKASVFLPNNAPSSIYVAVAAAAA